MPGAPTSTNDSLRILNSPTAMVDQSNRIGARSSASHGEASFDDLFDTYGVRNVLPDQLEEFYSTKMPLPPLKPEQTELVSVTASGYGPASQLPATFQVRRNLISAGSEYFRSVFDFRASNSQEMKTELRDVQPWVLATFISWLESGKIQFTACAPKCWTDATQSGYDERLKARIHAPTINEEHKIIPERYKVWGEDSSQPIGWQWTKLFELYLFADAYPSRPFRQAVLEIIQIKYSIDEQGFIDRWPEGEDIHYLFRSMPENSPLRRLVVDVLAEQIVDFGRYIDDPDCGGKKYLEEMPAEIVLQATLSLAKTVHAWKCCGRTRLTHICPPPGSWQCCVDNLHSRLCKRADQHNDARRMASMRQDWCYYHEHDSDEEKAVCLKRKDCLQGKVRLLRDDI